MTTTKAVMKAELVAVGVDHALRLKHISNGQAATCRSANDHPCRVICRHCLR